MGFRTISDIPVTVRTSMSLYILKRLEFYVTGTEFNVRGEGVTR